MATTTTTTKTNRGTLMITTTSNTNQPTLIKEGTAIVQSVAQQVGSKLKLIALGFTVVAGGIVMLVLQNV